MAEAPTVLEEEEGTPPAEETPANETAPEGDDPLKNEEEEKGLSADEIADDLLTDGTPRRKEISVKKDKFDEINEKAKIYDKVAPLLGKLSQKPEIVDELLKGENETVEERLARLEEDRKTKKRAEIKEVWEEAKKLWPDAKNLWSEMRPIVASLERQGLSYRDAIQRAYFAVNPDAAKAKERLAEQQNVIVAQNRLGMFSSSPAATKVVHGTEEEELPLSDADRDIMRYTGMTDKEYRKHWKKHVEPLLHIQ